MTLQYHTSLDAAQQRALGIDRPAPLAMADQVRSSEIDVLGHVNNAVYMNWFERLRVRYAGDYGLYSGRAGQAARSVIRSGTIHYRQEMLMDEDYVVTCRCLAFRTTSYTLGQQIWAGGTMRATLDCVVVLLHPDSTERFAIPQAVRDRFITRDGARQDG